MFGFNRNNTYTPLPTHHHHAGPRHHHVVHHQNPPRRGWGGFTFGFSPFSSFKSRPRPAAVIVTPSYTALRARNVRPLNSKVFGALLTISGIGLTALGFSTFNPAASITGIGMTAVGLTLMLA